MFRRPVVRRRGSPLLATAVVGGAAYAAGKSAQRGATREQEQQRLSQREQQGMGTLQQGYQSVPPAPPSASQQRYQPASQPQPQAAPAPSEGTPPQAASAAEPAPDKLTQLKTLGELRISGVLTEAEFEAEKQKILHA